MILRKKTLLFFLIYLFIFSQPSYIYIYIYNVWWVSNAAHQVSNSADFLPNPLHGPAKKALAKYNANAYVSHPNWYGTKFSSLMLIYLFCSTRVHFWQIILLLKLCPFARHNPNLPIQLQVCKMSNMSPIKRKWADEFFILGEPRKMDGPHFTRLGCQPSRLLLK